MHPIYLIAAEKGGVGKSTLATCLAAELSLSGPVVLLDTDPQATSARWHARRAMSGGDVSQLACRLAGPADDVAALAQEFSAYGTVVIDAGGRDSLEMRQALLVADVLLVPSRPSFADLEALDSMHTLVARAQAHNPGLRAAAVLTMVSQNPLVTEALAAREFVAARLPVLPVAMLAGTTQPLQAGDRKIYRDALAAGRGVSEKPYSNPRAAAEIQLLVEFARSLAAAV